MMTSVQSVTRPVHTVVIADDHTILRDGLSSLIAAEIDFEVVGTAADGHEATQLARELKPDLLLIDITMPRRTGIDAIESIKRYSPASKVLVLTFHKDASHVHAALSAGAHGYVLKDDSREELFSAMRSVLAGKSYLSPAIASHVVTGYLSSARGGDDAPASTPWDVLTQREREVIKLIAEGHRTRDIAEHLSLSPKTVEKHRSSLMKKLDLHSVSEVTTYAIQNGLVG